MQRELSKKSPSLYYSQQISKKIIVRNLDEHYFIAGLRLDYGLYPHHFRVRQGENRMCIDVRKTCECGSHTVQFHLRDNVMMPQVIARLFCPSCQGNGAFDRATMLCDNGWTIEYDMELARGLFTKKLQIDPEDVFPEFIFDNGFACWQEMYPGEQEDIRGDREKIIELLQQDRNVYLQAMQNWNIERIERLKAEGWRKVQQA